MIRLPRPSHVVFALSLTMYGGGCASRMIGSGPHPISSLPAGGSGMVYYLAKDVLQVRGVAHYVRSGTVTIQEVSRRDDAGKHVSAPYFVVSNVGPTFVKSEASFDFVPTVDSNGFYRLDTRPGWFGRHDQTLGLSPHGILASVDAHGKGAAGSALGAVARIASSAVTMAGALGSPLQVPAEQVADLAELPLREQYFYASRPPALQLRATLFRQGKTRQRLLDGQIALATQDAGAISGAVLKEKNEAYKQALAIVEQELAATSARLQAAMADFFAAVGVAEVPFSLAVAARLELSAIPPHALLPDPTSRADALQTLGDAYPEMAKCLKDLRVLFTLEGAPVPRGGTAAAPPQEGASLFYRMPRPGVLRVYRYGQAMPAAIDETARELLLTELRDVALLHPDVPATALPSHASAWTTRRARIMFDANHRPKELSWQSGAAAADTAASVADALADFRKEAVTTAKQVATYRAGLRDARLADLQDDIERLTKKRERLEAQIDLQGAVATADQRLQLIQLTAQADLLEQQAEIETSRRAIAGGE